MPPRVNDKPDETAVAAAARRGVVWTSLEAILLAAFRIGPLVILARHISPHEYGVFAASAFVIAFLQPISTLGCDLAVTRAKEVSAKDLGTAWTISLMGSCLLAMLVAICANPISGLIAGIPEARSILLALAPVICINAWGAMATAERSRDLDFRRISIANLCSVVGSTCAVSIPLALLGYGYWALVFGLLAESVIRLSALGRLPKRPSYARDSARSLWHFGRGATIGKVLNSVALEGDYLIVGRLLGSNALGQYSRSYQLMAAPSILIGGAIQRVGTPTLAKLQDDPAALGRAFGAAVELVALLTVPIAVVAIVLADDLVRVMLGPGWSESVLLFQILAAGIFLRAGYRIAASVVLAMGLSNRFAAAQAGYAICVVGGAALASTYGVAAVAATTLLALGLFYVALSSIAALCCRMTLLAFLGLHWRPALAGCLAGAAAWLSSRFLVAGLEIPLVRLLSASAITLVTSLLVAAAMPKVLLGPNGMRLFAIVLKRFGKGETNEAEKLHEP